MADLEHYVSATGRQLALALERAGVIERSRLRATLDLAWPRIVTGFARMSQTTADLAMVGLVLGSPAIAGLAFAYAYWQISNQLSLGLSGGTISLVSRSIGAGRPERADRTINGSLVVATVISIPLAATFYWHAEALIGLVGASPAAIGHGSVYLTIVAPALVFEFYNKVGSRVFAGIGDTFTPMVFRAGGAVVNIAINAVLIFGLGMGVVGAAVGTVVATLLVTALFAWGLLGRSYPMREPVPVGVRFAGPVLDTAVLVPLVRVSTPLMFQNLARSLVVFPLLGIAAVFGPSVVAAYEIARRVRSLVNSLSWGFSIASSSLVGRHLGGDDETVAASYGTEIIRLSLVSFAALAVLVVVLARPIARLFVTDPAVVALATTFVRVAAVSAIFLGLDMAAMGALRGAGDTRWPFYGALVGLYGFALPIAYLGVVTPLGMAALYVALLAETAVPAAITAYRFQSGAWRGVSRELSGRADRSMG